MSTQLRLVEPLPAPHKARTAKARAVKASTVKGGAARRPATWGEWRLDARTRRVGREGVAAARRALEDAPATLPLSRAS